MRMSAAGGDRGGMSPIGSHPINVNGSIPHPRKNKMPNKIEYVAAEEFIIRVNERLSRYYPNERDCIIAAVSSNDRLAAALEMLINIERQCAYNAGLEEFDMFSRTHKK